MSHTNIRDIIKVVNNIDVSVDVEEGIGNAHANHTLPNSTPGHAPESPCKDDAGGEDDEEKSVLQVIILFSNVRLGIKFCIKDPLSPYDLIYHGPSQYENVHIIYCVQ